MILFGMIFIAAVSFLIGFLVGVKDDVPTKKYKFETKTDEDSLKLQKEYENFLNYDGSLQE